MATLWRQKRQRHLIFKLNLIFIVILYTIVQDFVSGLFVRWEQRPVCLHGHDHIPVAHSCHAFYHCWGARITIKHCGPFLMFNPVTKVCDWPHTVKYIRPMCDPSYVKPPSNELKRVDLIKPTVNELASKNSTTKTIGKLLHARTTTKSTTTTTTTTLIPTTRRRKTISTSKPKRPKIFFIKPITIQRKRLASAKDMNLKDRNTKSLIGYNGLFDLNSLKVFTKGNMTSLSS